MRIDLLFIFTITITVSSCSGNSDQENENQQAPKSSVEYCLEQKMKEYYDHYEEMRTDLVNDGIVDDSKNSYANLYETIYDFEYTHTFIDSAKNMQYQFLDGIGPHSRIFFCSQLAKTDTVLTDNQRQYYGLYETSGHTGSFLPESVAKVIRSMSEAEFNSNSVKETSVFFLGHKYIFNRYCCYSELEKVP
ncbi:MAG: hypothetical protein GQ574_07235 [Crocinitomix sp.]|nr:hypothetical protein [Crocinitomix sp.]